MSTFISQSSIDKIQPGDVLIEKQVGFCFLSRMGATRQLSFRQFDDALRIGFAFAARHRVRVFVLGHDREYRVVTRVTASDAA